MSDAQKKLYMYILTQDTSITEKDAYTIALRMPPDVDWEAKRLSKSVYVGLNITKQM